MNYLIAGAGYTGRRIYRRLPVDRTWRLRRRPWATPSERDQALDFDAESLALPSLPRPWSLVYTVPPSQDSESDDRLRHFLAALDTPPERAVYLSTSGVYGDRRGALTDETTPPNPSTARAKRRQDAERALGAWCANFDVRLTILRVPGIYGPDRLGLDRLRAGEPVLSDADSAPGNRIHVDDLAAACVAALTAPPGVYNVGDGDHRSSSAFARAVAALAGLPPPAEITLAEAKQRWSATRLSFVREARRLDLTRMREKLGVSPRYADPEDGIRASLAEEKR